MRCSFLPTTIDSEARRIMSHVRRNAALALKQIIYRQRGEPYVVGRHTLRYVPGTRPVRLRYTSSDNDVVRYDALQIGLLAAELSEGDVAIDVGAHAGQYSLIMAARCGVSGQVVAFEPDPYARQMMQQNLQLNRNVKKPRIESMAVSDAPGEAVLYSRRGNANSSLVRSGLEGGVADACEKIAVAVVTLDSYLHDSGLPTPRWVKIDTEGAEIRVLKGAEQLLASDAGILCELHPYAWHEFGNSYEELKRLAAASRRRIRYLDQQGEVGDEVKYGVVLLEHLS
jgi:FkbM family methyltransferase